MGSRTVWKIASDYGQAIHLYSHWGGSDKLRATVEALLRAEPRWSDEDYFRRIFVSWIINDSWDMETGHGLWAGSMNADYFEENYIECEIYPELKEVIWDGVTFTYEEFIEFAKTEMSSQAQIALEERV